MYKIALTHNGPFHADDVFSGIVLQELGWKIMRIDREENDEGELLELLNLQSEFSEASFLLFDIGRKYNPDKFQFDHHFLNSPTRPAPNEDIQYSSIGLIWNHMAEEFLDTVFESNEAYNQLDEIEKQLVIKNVDRFITTIDGLDTGTIPKRRQDPTSIISFIGSFNPSWTNKYPDFDASYGQVIKWIKPGFYSIIQTEIDNVLAKKHVLQLIENRTDPKVLWMETNMPWMGILLKTESANDIEFCMFTNTSGNWVIQTVPIKPGCDDKRKNLPKKWAGLSGKELVEITGVEDAVFCHPARFIASATSKEGITKMLELALIHGEPYVAPE